MSDVLERHRVLIIAMLSVLMVGGVAAWGLGRSTPGPIIISTPEPTATPAPQPTATPAPLRVYVTGAVVRSDVYLLPAGSLVKDAIAAAGGATGDANLEGINLAIQVVDQQQIHVPRKGEVVTPIVSPGGGVAPVGKVNINTASIAELDALPGIGPAIAQRIVDYRAENGDFRVPEDLMNVKGIGPSTFEKLKDQITVR